jgi:2-iminobutanoate/2-iminopropanoate deaminase
MIKPIHTTKAPAAIGPYSQAMTIGDLVFCSGQTGIHPETGKLAEGLTAQAEQLLTNLREVLKAAGSDLQYVLKTTVFLTNVDDFAAMNEIYSAHFGEHKPARSTVEVSNLPKGALIEIEAIAIQPATQGESCEGCGCGGCDQ